MSSYGKSFQLSIFGESHGPAVGALITGIAPGIEIDREYIKRQMQRRSAAEFADISTPRKEADEVEFLSGVHSADGKTEYTTGTPLCLIIKNQNTKSSDYSKLRRLPRPGHADYTGSIKYQNYSDFRGGGHFSGRLTAPLVAAGAIFKYILHKKEIEINSHILRLANVQDEAFARGEHELAAQLAALKQNKAPAINIEAWQKMQQEIKAAAAEKDSVGGIIEAAVTGMHAGIGEPFFSSVESEISSLLFSIPAVKGVEFGAGFSITDMRASKANDEFFIDENTIKTKTNNNGGINGGITNGMPVLFKAAFKPTPSIAKAQQSVNTESMKEETLEITGRHDPCIVQRALPVVEAAAAIALVDLFTQRYGNLWQKAENEMEN